MAEHKMPSKFLKYVGDNFLVHKVEELNKGSTH